MLIPISFTTTAHIKHLIPHPPCVWSRAHASGMLVFCTLTHALSTDPVHVGHNTSLKTSRQGELELHTCCLHSSHPSIRTLSGRLVGQIIPLHVRPKLPQPRFKSGTYPHRYEARLGCHDVSLTYMASSVLISTALRRLQGLDMEVQVAASGSYSRYVSCMSPLS